MKRQTLKMLVMENNDKRLQRLKDLSIKRNQLRTRINNLRRQKTKVDEEINDLVNQMINEE